VARCAGAVRYARCGEPMQHCQSFELCSDVATGERPEIERLMGSFGEGWLEKLCQLGGRSLATYSTCTTGLEEGVRKRTGTQQRALHLSYWGGTFKRDSKSHAIANATTAKRNNTR
jgi:hypothetical protein